MLRPIGHNEFALMDARSAFDAFRHYSSAYDPDDTLHRNGTSHSLDGGLAFVDRA